MGKSLWTTSVSPSKNNITTVMTHEGYIVVSDLPRSHDRAGLDEILGQWKFKGS